MSLGLVGIPALKRAGGRTGQGAAKAAGSLYTGEFGAEFPRDDWETPPELFRSYDGLHHFTLDPAANHRNALVATYFDREADGLLQRWAPHTVWLHPPHSDVGAWILKARTEARSGATVVALIPCHTHTDWWHDIVMKDASVRFLRGMPKFRLQRIPLTERADRLGPQDPFAVAVFKPGKTL